MKRKKSKTILIALIIILFSSIIFLILNIENKCDGVAWYSFQRNGDTIYKQCNSSLMWTNASTSLYSWGGATIDEPTDSCIGIHDRPACNYCENLTYGGYEDWILPNTVALKSFCFLNIIQDGEYYWTSDEHRRTHSAWFVWFDENCYRGQGSKLGNYKVICMRGD